MSYYANVFTVALYHVTVFVVYVHKNKYESSFLIRHMKYDKEGNDKEKKIMIL